MSASELLQPIHIWHQCHACGAQPIVGKRFECENCPIGPDNSLCETCYALFERGTVTHPKPDSLGGNASRSTRHTFRILQGQPADQYIDWLSTPLNRTPSPYIPNYFVVRPEFRSKSDSFFGGHAFAVQPEDGELPILLTALHVMDELIKSKRVNCRPNNLSYTGKELPSLITGVTLYDVFAAKWMFADLGSAHSMRVLPDARVGEEEPRSHRDIAAFQIDNTATIAPLKLALRPPQPGEAIWLAASKGQTTNGRAFEAVVVERTDQTLIFRFAAPPNVLYSSGAPLLNSNGEVVGINVGAGILDGHHFGHANHVTNIRRHLGWDP